MPHPVHDHKALNVSSPAILSFFLYTVLGKRFNFILSHVTFHFFQHYLWNRLSSCIGRINIVKMVILSKASHRYSAITIKTSMAFFKKLEQMILKFMWRHRRPQVAEAVLTESWGSPSCRFQPILLSCRHKSRVVPALD